jgi:hypothetical protein
MELSNVELLSLGASIASLVLAIVAICLSYMFYKLSSETSEKAKESSMSVMYSVKELEKIYGLLRTESFSLVRETVNYAWSREPNKIESERAAKTEERINDLKNDFTKQIATLFTEQDSTGNKINELNSAISSLLTEAKNIESKVKEETIRDYIIKSIKEIRKRNRRPIADLIIDKAIDDGLRAGDVAEELHKMKDDKYIHFEGERIENGTVEIVLLKETE